MPNALERIDRLFASGSFIELGVCVFRRSKSRYARAISKGSSPFDMAGIYTAQDVIDPRDTRERPIRMLEVHRMRLSGGVGEHLMRAWPTNS